MTPERLIIACDARTAREISEEVRTTEATPTVIALDFWAQEELRARGVPHEPFDRYQGSAEALEQVLSNAESFARLWYRIPEMTFFRHGEVRIGEALEPPLRIYLQRVLRFAHHVEAVVEAHPHVAEIIIPEGGRRISYGAGPLAFFEARALTDAVRFVIARRGMHTRVIGQGASVPPSTVLHERITWRHRALRVLNALVRWSVPTRQIKIFASEYWSHIAPLLKHMPDAELVLMDRSEFKNIPWSAILSHRIRFVHPLDVMTDDMRAAAAEEAKQYVAAYQRAMPAIRVVVRHVSPNLDWWPLVEDAARDLVRTYAVRVIAEALAMERIIRTEKSNRVVLRASHSGRQPHFFVATRVAYALNVPSIELQHAIEIVDPRTVRSRIEAAYLAAYGRGTQEMMRAQLGIAPERVRPIGSPRFDAYLQNLALSQAERVAHIRRFGLDPEKMIVVVAFPTEGPNSLYMDFYPHECAAYIRELRALYDAVPDIQLILKFRPGSMTTLYQRFISEVFPDGGIACVDGDAFPVLRLADVVMVGNSTMMFEALIAEKALVLYPVKAYDTYFRARFKDAGVGAASYAALVDAMRALVQPVHRQEVAERGKEFLRREYAFDGHSSERLAAFLREDLPSRPAGFVRQ